MKLQFRIRPIESLLDVDPPLIHKAMDGLQGVEDLRIFDDRTSDATFVTLVVNLSDSSPQALRALQVALLSIPRVRVLIVDSAGNEAVVSKMPATALLEFAEK